MTRKKHRVPGELADTTKHSHTESPRNPATEDTRDAIEDIFSNQPTEEDPDSSHELRRTRSIPDTFDRSLLRDVLVGERAIELPDGFEIAIKGVPWPRMPRRKK